MGERAELLTGGPGIAGTFLKAGILPLPVSPTSFRLGYDHGVNVGYGFPITGGNPDLNGPSGDIFHSGGIDFVSFRGKLDIGTFDIDLAKGKIFATQVNFKKARIAVLDLDLSGLKVTTRHGTTVLSGIIVKLDPAAADALSATFGIHLPGDGSLVFGSATVTLRTSGSSTLPYVGHEPAGCPIPLQGPMPPPPADAS